MKYSISIDTRINNEEQIKKLGYRFRGFDFVVDTDMTKNELYHVIEQMILSLGKTFLSITIDSEDVSPRQKVWTFDQIKLEMIKDSENQW